jgi:hypothetical protein
MEWSRISSVYFAPTFLPENQSQRLLGLKESFPAQGIPNDICFEGAA